MNYAELQQQFAQKAQACSLQVQCLGDGNINSEIAIVAEAPGDNEVRLRTPLVGGTGRFLWEMLRSLGIQRQHCYVTNVIKRQIKGSGINDKETVDKNELEHWNSLLQWELSCLPNVKYVLVLGGASLRALTGHTEIEAWRGSCVQVNGRWYIISYNPAYALRRPELEVIMRLDFYKLDLVRRGAFKEHSITPTYNQTPDDMLRSIERFADEKQPLSLDIETSSGETACIGLANNSHTGTCFNFRERDSNRFTVRDETTVRVALARLLADDSTRIITQNGSFDRTWLWYKDRIRTRPIWFDTMLAHHTLYPGLPHNLGFLTAQYTTHPYYKDEKDTWRENGDINKFWEYNVKDCCITWACHTRLLDELRKTGLDGFFFNHVMRLQPHLIGMTIRGVLLDVQSQARMVEALYADVAKLEAEFYNAVAVATGDPLYKPNPNSPRQMSELYFKRLALVGKGGKTDKTNRQHMLNHPRTSPPAKAVLIAQTRLSTDSKFLSTFAEVQPDEDGRVRCEYKQTGTMKAPGRLSSSKTLWGSGMNLQNQPNRARGLFIADRDRVFVYFDLSQAEARFVAWDASIASWKQQFEKARLEGGYDAHRALCGEMFNIPYDQTPAEDYDEAGVHTTRYIAKRCRHGLNYRMGPDRLAEVTGLSPTVAMQAYNIYHRITPELRKWWTALENEVREKRCLVNAFGRRMPILGRIDSDEQLESIVAFRPQSTIGDKVSRVIYQTESDARWPAYAHMLLNIHDALIAICKPDDAKRVGAIMKQYAEEPIIVKGEPMIIPADLKVSVPSSYDEAMKLVKDPAGMHRWGLMDKLKL
jgi:uracil-DNA glycosylase family 4